MRPTIEVVYPDGRTESVVLTKERSIVGRSPNAQIKISDNRVSREHCALELKGDRIFVVDLGGSNGTWIGASKLLANVPEPFPREEIVHVGPAQLRNVTSQPSYDPDSDLESQAFAPVAPQRQRSASPAAAAAAAAPVGPGRASEAALEPVQRRLTMNPGERSTVQFNITNQGKIVDHYNLSVVGVPTTWITLPTTGLELLPRQSGMLSIDVHPPRHTRTTAGVHPLDVALISQTGQVVVQTRIDLEILPFENFAIEIRPNPYQSRSGGTMILTVENHGNAQTDYRVSAVEASDSLDITVDPTSATVAPQQSRENAIRLRPRKRNLMGEPRRMNITITVSGESQSSTLNPGYTQLNLIPRWLPILLLLACCVIIPLFAFLAYPEVKPVLFPTDTPVPTNTPEHTPTATPDLGATMTATRDIWCGLDDDGDGLTNCDEVNNFQTQFNSRDTDNDGLSDFDEVKKTNTDPLNNDSDGDTLLDGVEEQDVCLSPTTPDTDADGVPDQIDPDSCTGITPTPSPVPDFALGGQVNNTLDFADVMEDARMSWIKVQLRFGVGADASSTVQDITKFKEKGFKVLLSVVGNKEELERGGAAYHQTFADFLGSIAPVADGIEVWNEPNIQNEWPVGKISPTDYTEMLRKAHTAIKNSNPRTIVISAAPAPTGVNNETVMSDDRFIAGMMAAGARNFMDCIGIHYNAGATPPSAESGHPSDSNGHYSYYFLPMMNLYFDTFNPEGSSSELPLCFTEIGYLTDDGFDLTLAQAGANNFLWADGISEREQAEWLEEALLRSCRSGMVKLFIVWNVGFENYGQDPQAGYSIFRPDEDCPSCETLSRAVGVLRNEGCMR